MSGQKKDPHSSHDGTERPETDQSEDAGEMNQDWLARLRDNDSGWDEPAFPERQAGARPDQARTEAASGAMALEANLDEDEPERRAVGVRPLALGLLGVLALLWLGFAGWSLIDPASAQTLAAVLARLASLATPLALLVGIAVLLMLPGRAPRAIESPAPRTAGDAEHIREATMRLGAAQDMLLGNTRQFASIADQSASAILSAMQAMSKQTTQIEQGTSSSITTLTGLGAQITQLTDALPRLEDRLATLGETMRHLNGELGNRHETLDHQLQTTALVAEEARLQLVDAGAAITDKLTGLRESARQAGEELANLSELSSARIDLTLDRVRSVLESTGQRIEHQNAALADLVEQSRAGIESAADQSFGRFETHCRRIETLLDALDTRIVGQAEKSNGWLEGTAQGVAALASEFDTFEQSATARSERLHLMMSQLSGETRRLSEALAQGHDSSDTLITRAEALLVALDSGIRELDESLPGAIGRVELRLTELSTRIQGSAPQMEAVEVVADGVLSKIQEVDQVARDQVRHLSETLERSQGALGTQKEQIAALAQTIGEASATMAQLGEVAGPRMVEALARVRETADAAATRAREAITAVIPQSVAALGEASTTAVEQAVEKGVSEQLQRLSQVADEAVMAAHRATDKLTRQMLGLTDASKEMERALASNAERIEGQDRDLMAERSARLIDTLKQRALDVAKWLDRDVSDADWSAYLKGDQGLFARRATRLMNAADARLTHALYNDDADFREHVNRYVHDFEALLRTVLASRDGSTLALTMISSDIGKLYVALAQAIERLRTS